VVGLAPCCRACGGADLRSLLTVDRVPAVVGALWPTAAQARDAITGRLEMVICYSCSHISNVAFDRSLVDYDPGYENSLHFSPTFRQYADELAERLVERYDVRGKTVLEIGSGKGEFLQLLCAKGSNQGVGYDPTYAGESDTEGVTFVRALYPLDGTGDAFDVLACRHVLEHLAEPYELLAGLRKSCVNADARLYFEVPNGEFTMSASGQWDLIYPHVSYFTESSMCRLLRRSGFEVLQCGTAFDGQFLYAEVAPSDVCNDDGDHNQIKASVVHAEAFAATYWSTIAEWRHRLVPAPRLADERDPDAGGSADDGAGAALWGAGAKGTTFLNALGRDSRVVAVVDVNPRKWGRFVPGTGHQVAAPAALRDHVIGTVIITNSTYRREISEELAVLGITADVVCV